MLFTDFHLFAKKKIIYQDASIGLYRVFYSIVYTVVADFLKLKVELMIVKITNEKKIAEFGWGPFTFLLSI